MYELNHLRISILIALAFTEEKEKTVVMIKFLFKLFHRKEVKAEMFKRYVVSWRFSNVCFWKEEEMQWVINQGSGVSVDF